MLALMFIAFVFGVAVGAVIGAAHSRRKVYGDDYDDRGCWHV